MIVSLLQRMGVLPAIFQSEVEDAQSEDVLRTSIENSKAIENAKVASVRTRTANGRLLESIRQVKSTSRAFADFERSVRGIHD